MWDLKPINKLFIFLYTKIHLLPVHDSVTCTAHLKIQVHCVMSIPLYSIVKKMSAKYPILSHHNLPVSRPFRRTWGSREHAAASAGIPDNRTCALPQHSTALRCAAEVLCVYFPRGHAQQ